MIAKRKAGGANKLSTKSTFLDPQTFMPRCFLGYRVSTKVGKSFGVHHMTIKKI